MYPPPCPAGRGMFVSGAGTEDCPLSAGMRQPRQALDQPALKGQARGGAAAQWNGVHGGAPCREFVQTPWMAGLPLGDAVALWRAALRPARSHALSWKKKATACTVGSSKLRVSDASKLPVTA